MVRLSPVHKCGDDEALEISVECYLYAYPLVLMEVTRRLATNVESPIASPGGGGAPMNQFVHLRAFPDPCFTDVVRPNADTLYSVMWFDVSKEPLVVSVPDSDERYYLLPLLDMWTDIFASPGMRTTGCGPQNFAIVGPQWTGKLPEGVELLRCPTGMGWMIGRTQTNATPDDLAKVHKFQDGLGAKPLSAWGEAYEPPKGTVDPTVSKVPPVEQVREMDAGTFFALFAELMKDNPPHANDYPILARLKRIGIEPGKSFDLAKAPESVQLAMKEAVKLATQQICNELERSPKVNTWRMVVAPVGTYGTAYLQRAGIAYVGIGAVVSEDAIYPAATVDACECQFDSSKKYVLHFEKAEIPQARAFWSLTMYNDAQLFAANPIDRYAIGDRNHLKFDGDGSLTLYIQRESPGEDKVSNWLPTPETGWFSMNLRLYWPRAAALDGTWKPPAVERRE